MYPVSRFHRTLTADQVLTGYAAGIFPLGQGNRHIVWCETNPRAILPIERPEDFPHLSRSLRQVIARRRFEVRIDTAFEQVMRGCAFREDTWINDLVLRAYTGLHRRGFAHSVESWRAGRLVGGLYGVSLRGGFFGESMFHLEPDASKAAAVRLLEILKAGRYLLLDIQMMTPVFEAFGAIEIPKRAYHALLRRSMEVERVFDPDAHCELSISQAPVR
ncbi:MAG: leucyl/phenylalanyl-tRNA--protein transferase [Planctomycetes bacterium]|nr:leucyl/phenylalanyl-tRNA--protein transferase [Planctomycetota bacterium]